MYSGSILADGSLAGVTVGGSVIGGTGNYSGDIVDNGNLGQVTIGPAISKGRGASFLEKSAASRAT